MHARLSTVCNYEITLDPLYASIIIAFYASVGETTTNFSIARAVLKKSFSIFLVSPHSFSFSFYLARKVSVRFVVDKLSSLFRWPCPLVKCLFPSIQPTFGCMAELFRI